MTWRHVFHPVVMDLFSTPVVPGPRVTTVMNWQSYPPLAYDGTLYGHKDVEFPRFLDLPSRTSVPFEIGVAGKSAPIGELVSHGWGVVDAHALTRSFDSFREHVIASLAEFSVCKNGFVATWSGWFGDRTAAYLAAGRPAVVQDTGFSAHLPCGEGLFAVSSVDEAADAIGRITADYDVHSRAAQEVASEFLDATKVLLKLLDEAGV